ncbi:MAG: tyrosine--tRNA ligase [Patescibacteria group bacterium]
MKVVTDEKKIDEILTRGVEEVIEKDHLKKKLLSGKQVRVKFGIDPTMPDLHLGHSVPLRKLRQFQDLGHKAVLIIGDYTAMIGDPTGRTETRKVLTEKEVKVNMKKYLNQAGKILDIKKTEVRYNSEWLDKGLEVILSLAQAGTVNQMLRRADFRQRMDNDLDITVLELMYPLMQGYDSVSVKADVELGGTDQKFNLLMGRKVQRHFDQPEQDVVTFPLLEGLDGVKKMSKSFGNYIALDEKPKEMFGKIMSIPDTLINKYIKLCTNLSLAEIDNSRKQNPRDLKMKLAHEIVKICHGEDAAQEAQENFIHTFQKKEIPETMPEIKCKIDELLSEVLVKNKILSSKSEWRRLVGEKAVHDLVKNQNILEVHLKISTDLTLRIGKKKFVRILI